MAGVCFISARNGLCRFGEKPEEYRRLFQEEARRFGLVEMIAGPGPEDALRFYYGVSLSRSGEPLDQLDSLLLVSRLARALEGVRMSVFVAGRFAELNGRDGQELRKAEIPKAKLYLSAMELLRIDGNLNLMRVGGYDLIAKIPVLMTDQLWYSPLYWQEVMRIKDMECIVDFSRKGRPFREVVCGFEPELRARIPKELLDSIGDVDAPSLYRLLEVAEASYLRSCSINMKIGPESEEQYDSYIQKFMGVMRLRQPLDLRSMPGKARPLIPYIGKEGEERILLGDGKAELWQKVMKLAQRSSDQPIMYEGFMNPFVRTAILSVEAAASADSVPVAFYNRKVSDGAGALELFRMAGTDQLMRYAPIVAEALWCYLIRPLRQLMDGRAREDAQGAEALR